MNINDGHAVSRRSVIGSAGLGVTLAAASAPVLAASPAAPQAQPLEDPTSKYPRPPYPRQSQPWPGLASKMDPRPDHGETSYRGSGRLLGRKALITGGDSGMGRAAAIAYAREGADVAINYLPEEEPDAREVIALIKAEGRIGLAIPGDLRDEAFCQRLVADAVRGLGGLDIVVSNAGRQQAHDSILDITTEQFDWTMKTNIYAPFWIIKAALPHMPPGSAIIATHVRAGLRPDAGPLRLRADQGGDDELREVAGQAARAQGHPRQRRGARPDLDAVAGQRRRDQEKLEKFGGQTPLGRAGQPAELGSIYVQLAAADASFATGQVYGAAGGSGQP